MEHFQNVMDDVVVQCGGSIIDGHTGFEDAIIKERETTREALTANELASIVDEANNRAKVTAFFLGCDRADMENSLRTQRMIISSRVATPIRRLLSLLITWLPIGSNRTVLDGKLHKRSEERL